MLNPYVLIALGAIWLGTAGGSYWLGYKHCTNAHKADQLAVMEEVVIEAEKQAEADHKTAENYERARETVRTVYIKVKERADENIENNRNYAECGLDADGLRLYNAKPSAD